MEAKEHQKQPYILIWVILLVLTLAELGYAFMDLPKIVLAIGLIGMAVWKALLVALYYMHLRYEESTLSRFFSAGFILAISLYTLVLTALGVLAVRGG